MAAATLRAVSVEFSEGMYRGSDGRAAADYTPAMGGSADVWSGGSVLWKDLRRLDKKADSSLRPE
jgi:hypothetical protein